MTFVRLHDHNIEGANGIAVHVGRFEGTVKLEIRGTIGFMTVSAQELVDAIKTIMRCATHAPALGTGALAAQKPARSEIVKLATKRRRSARRNSVRKTTIRSDSASIRMITAASFMGSLQRDTISCSWTAREDAVVRVLKPIMAAEKLHRPIEEIQARRQALGLEHMK